MDAQTLTIKLDHEYALLARALDAADVTAAVPTCPEWTAADLAEHVTMVYLHKVECMRRGEFPKPWPPSDPGSLADAYTALRAEFAARAPGDTAVTWFDPDQTVGFWIRRMAQETAVHRVDAELAGGATITPIDDDLAVDGIDELMKTFVAFASASWPADFAEVLSGADRRPILVSTGGRAWTVTATADRVLIADVDPSLAADATVTGHSGNVYRWLWNRGGDVEIIGDADLASQLHAVMGPAMQ